MKETQTVISNIIHDMKIINQKTEAGVWGLRNYIEYKGDNIEFGDWMAKKIKEIKEIKEVKKIKETINFFFFLFKI